MTSTEQIALLSKRVKQLSQKIGILEDIQAIRTLHFKYGYYMDRFLVEEIPDLFSDEAELNLMGQIFRGRAGARRLFVGRIGSAFTNGHNAPVYGYMWDYLQMQDIIHVAPDRQTAKGRFRYLMQAGDHVSKQEPSPMGEQSWESGTYENTYIKEAGVWKILKFSPRISWRANYQTGWRFIDPDWLKNWGSALYPDDPLGPDEFREGETTMWPKAALHPFHYAHPVTGEPWKAEE